MSSGSKFYLMAAPSILSECHISVSQEEVLAHLREGWERNGQEHYSLDETPSQTNLPIPNSLNPHPPSSYEGDENDGSESSESVDDLGFVQQEPVEFFSPSTDNEGVANKEDSYVAAFESDRSQSPSQDWIDQPQVQTGGASAEFLTQPAAGGVLTDFRFSESLQTIPEAECQGSSFLLPPVPENTVWEAPVLLAESSVQPFTQPAFETQPPESLNQVQEPVEQVQLAEERNEIVHDPTLERVGTEASQPMQQEHGQDELVKDSLAVDNNNGCTGEHTPGAAQAVDDTRHEHKHKQPEHGSHEVSRDIPEHVEIHGGSGVPEKAQALSEETEPETGQAPSNSERGNGEIKSLSKREMRNKVDRAEELQGQQKRRRVEALSPVTTRSFPKTVMDVVRSRSRSLSNSLVDDECNILNIIMRSGLTTEAEEVMKGVKVAMKSHVLRACVTIDTRQQVISLQKNAALEL